MTHAFYERIPDVGRIWVPTAVFELNEFPLLKQNKLFDFLKVRLLVESNLT